MKSKQYFLLLATLVLTTWVYLPGLNGPFVFDDHHNIANNHLLKVEHLSFAELWQASLSSDSGPLKRPVVMFSFAINHVFTGMDPWWMKLTNLIIHLINGVLVFLLLKQLFCRFNNKDNVHTALIPFFIAGLWMVHPINVTSVSYIVQRMTSLSATFVLLAICCYMKLREGKALVWKRHLLSVSIFIFWALGLLSKETGILLSIYIFAIEWSLYGFKTDSKEEKAPLRLVWFMLSAPWVCAVLYAIYDPSFITKGYAYRDFTIVERILTEFRIVSEYIRLIIIPDVRLMGLFHDDIVLSTSLLTPITTLLGLLLIVSLLVLAIKWRIKYPLFSLGVLWFFGGHLLESTVFPLELMFLHRNYLPAIGILLILAEVLMRFSERYRSLCSITVVLIMLGFSVGARSVVYQWSGDLRMLLMEVINNPTSIRANFRAGQAFKYYSIVSLPGEERDKYKKKAIEYFSKIREYDSDDVTGELGILETYIQLEEVPPRILIEDLIDVLPVVKVNRGVINVFISIKRCFIENECPLESEDFERMLAALLSNHYIGKDIKRIILIINAEYLADAKLNIDAAIRNVLEAIILSENLEDFMLLAQYYVRGSYLKEAERTISYLEEHDRLGKFRKFINETKVKIRNE